MIQFISDKIIIPTELPRISRARLLTTLKESLATCNSTILHGRAGTGKTVLATDFTRQCERAVAWYKIEAPDGELKLFFEYLCASVRKQRPGFGEKTLQRIEESTGVEDVPLLVEYFIYELLESAEPLLIVIDDLHLIYDADWVVPFFRRLLPLLPREAHLMLIGRGLPPAPLWRMRSKQTLCVIDETALAFNLKEAQKLFASYGLPAEEAEEALMRTWGRAATLDAQASARAATVSEDKAKATVSSREGRRSRPLRLVKGFGRKSSMGTA